MDSFKHDIRIDPVYHLKCYIERTSSIRKSDDLFITHNAPHGQATVITIARWIAQVISMWGQTGSGGSTRSVSTSYALAKGASLADILDAGNWTRETTFKKFYYQPVPLSFMKHVFGND